MRKWQKLLLQKQVKLENQLQTHRLEGSQNLPRLPNVSVLRAQTVHRAPVLQLHQPQPQSKFRLKVFSQYTEPMTQQSKKQTMRCAKRNRLSHKLQHNTSEKRNQQEEQLLPHQQRVPTRPERTSSTSSTLEVRLWCNWNTQNLSLTSVPTTRPGWLGIRSGLTTMLSWIMNWPNQPRKEKKIRRQETELELEVN